MKRAEVTVTFSTRVDDEEQAEEYFDEVIDNLNRSDYEITDSKVESMDEVEVIERVNQVTGFELSDETKARVKRKFDSQDTIEIPVETSESESTLYIVWESQSDGQRYLDTAYMYGDKTENDKILEALTEPQGSNGIVGNDRFRVSNPEEAIEHTEKLLDEAGMSFAEVTA